MAPLRISGESLSARDVAAAPTGAVVPLRPSWPERHAPLLAVFLVGLLVVPRLPRGVCFDDSGDLQGACRALGVAHAPGYVGYVTFGWLLTRVVPLEPALVVTVACCASGLLALAACSRVQAQLGAHPLAAGAVALLCAAHPALRDNLFVPEVYAPTAALLLLALVYTVAYRRTGRSRYLYTTALLLGVSVSSRTPAVLLVPGFGLGLWLAGRARGLSRARAARALITALLLAGVPCLYSFAYLWCRNPDPRVSYLARGGASGREALVALGPRAKMRQTVWCLMGSDYTVPWSTSWPAARARTQWVLREALPHGTGWWLVVFVPLCGVGFVRIARRAPEVAWPLAGIFVGGSVLLILVHTDGTAADYLPALLVGGVCAGVGLSGNEPPVARGQLFAARWLVFLAAAACAGLGLARKPVLASTLDADSFLAALDVRTLPDNALILAPYFESTAVGYARLAAERDDIEVLAADPARAAAVLSDLVQDARPPDRPVFTTGLVEVPCGWHSSAYRNLHRLVPDAPE